MPQINTGNAANDGTGSKLRAGGQLINQYGLLGDKTVNAAFYKTASITNEAAITLAIVAAALLGTGAAVWVPQSMLPYNASLVTFNPAVQMLREGGTARWLDLLAYGADGSGSGTLCDASFTAVIARAVYLYSLNLGSGMPTAGGTIYVPQGTYYISTTIDLTPGNLVCELIGDGPRLTRIITSVTTTAGINAAKVLTAYTVLRGFTLYQNALAIPGAARSGNYGIRVTGGVGTQLIIDEVEVNYFANSAIFIEGPTGPTVISNCSIQFNAGWGLELAKVGGVGCENVQMIAGNIHNCWGGIKGDGPFGCQFHAADIENGTVALWPCIYLTGAAYGNSFYECTISAQPLQALVNPSNGIVVVDSGIANTFINGINLAGTGGTGQGTDNYRFVGSTDRQTVIGGNHQSVSPGGGFFAVIQSVNNIFLNPLVIASTYTAGKNIVSDVAANFTTMFGAGTSDGATTSGTSYGAGSATFPRRVQEGVANLTSGTTPALDASLSNFFSLTILTNIAVVIAAPTNIVGNISQEITIAMRNGSGGALTTPPTFNTGAGGFKFPAGVIVNPANGTQVLYKFRWDTNQGFWYLTGAPTTVGY